MVVEREEKREMAAEYSATSVVFGYKRSSALSSTAKYV